MSFFSDLGRTLGGAAVGFATGGPLGAVAGGVGGVLSGSTSGRTATSHVQYRPYTQEELQMIQAAQQAIQQNMAAMSPEQRDTYINELTGTYYEPMARQINDHYRRVEGQTRVAYARGGMLGSSFSEAGRRQIAGDVSREQADAYARARMMGEQSYFNREQNRRANLSSSQQILDAVEARRRGERTQTTVYPDMFPNDLMTGAGYALTSPTSYLNTNINLPGWLGGKKKTGPLQ